jgi:PQQ-dependent dehydrogenase (methanol/ethanol family)
MIRAYRKAGVLLVTFLLAAPSLHGQVVQSFRPVTQAELNDPDPSDWLMWRRTYNGWGYSPLDQIDRSNVSRLQLVWSYGFEPHRQGLQSEPLVRGGVIYMRHPTELLTAHDATTGDLIWEYRRQLPAGIDSVAGGITPHRGRGLAIYEEKLINFSTDGVLYALDARSGALLWETVMEDYRETLHQPSGAPVVYDGVIAVPTNCTAFASRTTCHLSAYDAEDGTMLWRWYTSPGPEDPLSRTWGSNPQKYPLEGRRNTSAWWTPSVDVAQGLFIFGVGSSAPMQPEIVGSPGSWPDRLYHGSTVALDYRTGEVVWWAQHQSDMHNNDSVFDRLLVDAPVNTEGVEAPWLGRNPNTRPTETRQLVVGSFNKDGIFYAYDRTNGEFLYARETAPQNVISSYDGSTGAYKMNPMTAMTTDTERVVTACKENRMVPQGAYSPLTNAYYVPVWAGCIDFRTITLSPTLADGYNLATIRSFINPESPTFGRPEAIDVSTGKTLWRLDREAPLYGMLTTGGGLLFAADTNRRFYAIDQWTGETLWQTILNGLSDMAPISYAVNGRQFVAVVSPGGTQVARSHLGRLGVRTPTTGQTLFVFALPED